MNNEILASAGKDCVIRLWHIPAQSEGQAQHKCIGTLKGHDKGIASICFTTVTESSSLMLLISTDKDGMAKVWNCSSLLKYREGGTPADLSMESSSSTVKAHPKAAETVDVAPNNQLVATGGKDKLVKLWKLHHNSLSPVGTLQGHRRGITAVKFSPVDRVLVSASIDTTLMLWSTTTNSCLKTFQGHETSICNVAFMNSGLQLISTDGDGMIKLWIVKTAECVATMNEQTDEDAETTPIWAVSVIDNGEYFMTGGFDSKITIFKDITKDKQLEAFKEESQQTAQLIKLQNLLRAGEYADAFSYALKLRRKNDLRNIINQVVYLSGREDGNWQKAANKLQEFFRNMPQKDLSVVLTYCRDWNANATHCDTAQYTLKAILQEFTLGKLAENPAVKETLEALTAYGTRHITRLTNLREKTYLLDHMLSNSTLEMEADREITQPTTTTQSQPQKQPHKKRKLQDPAAHNGMNGGAKIQNAPKQRRILHTNARALKSTGATVLKGIARQ
eukprot:TRINITY_DN55147_c0_g1_i2.p1 TRINITY_DN55147_c0_g1~~TRINITY_DN55147_c0_g1_i2.p1  ORF type:complete len:529 (-),score=39.24 TRINITY_DN55147_c0_g1_i2:68-1582(-)